MGIPVRTPGSTKSALIRKYRWAISSRVALRRGHNRADDDAADVLGVEASASVKRLRVRMLYLVHGLVARGGEPPIGDQRGAAKDAQHGVGVADIDGQQHQDASATSPEVTTAIRPSSRRTRSRPFGSRPSVVPE